MGSLAGVGAGDDRTSTTATQCTAIDEPESNGGGDRKRVDETDKPDEPNECTRATLPIRLTPACVDDTHANAAAIFCVSNDHEDSVTLEWTAVDPPANRLEFVDCQTVRAVGEFTDLIVTATFLGTDGALGNVIEPVGGVGEAGTDGDQTICLADLEQFPEDAIIASVEAFQNDPVVPGAGEFTVANPQFAACWGSGRDDDTEAEPIAPTGGGMPQEQMTDTEADTESETAANSRSGTLTIPPGSTTCFPVALESASDPVLVRLEHDGELVAERSSLLDVSCPFPLSLPVGRTEPVTVSTDLLERFLPSVVAETDNVDRTVERRN